MENINLPQTIEDREGVERQLLSLDSEFRFKCRRCGKCCKNQYTIVFTPFDLFKIAKKLGLTLRQVIDECAEIYIGRDSRIPIVHMVPKGLQHRCPLLDDDGRCRVHDCKPTVCALYPVGRVAVCPLGEKDEIRREDIQVKYILNDITCGSAKRVNTIRSWLDRFGIPEEDEFFLLWSEVTANLGTMVRALEARNASPDLMDRVWGAISQGLYKDYDTSKEFMPQFKAAVEKLNELCKMTLQLDSFSRGEAPFPERVAQMINVAAVLKQAREGAE